MNEPSNPPSHPVVWLIMWPRDEPLWRDTRVAQTAFAAHSHMGGIAPAFWSCLCRQATDAEIAAMVESVRGDARLEIEE